MVAWLCFDVLILVLFACVWLFELLRLVDWLIFCVVCLLGVLLFNVCLVVWVFVLIIIYFAIKGCFVLTLLMLFLCFSDLFVLTCLNCGYVFVWVLCLFGFVWVVFVVYCFDVFTLILFVLSFAFKLVVLSWLGVRWVVVLIVIWVDVRFRRLLGLFILFWFWWLSALLQGLLVLFR